MTIKEFAKLCECNPQTLRYYDSIDLQKAGFAIDEIRQLLDQDDRVIYDAFENKIKEAEERLREIKLIRQSYQSEMSTIQSRIQELKDRILSDAKKYDPMEEFGFSPEEYERILGRIEQCLDTAENSPEDFPALQGVIDKISEMENKKPEIPDYRKDPNYQMIYERTSVISFLISGK